MGPDVHPAAAEPVVRAVGAEVRLGGRPVWSDVDLQVHAGEFVAVLGPNGVGKSTLVRAILGLVPLTAGELTVLGQAAGRGQPRASATCPSGAASIRACGSAASTSCAWASTATGGGSRCRSPAAGRAAGRADDARVDQVIELVGRHGLRRPPDRACLGG